MINLREGLVGLLKLGDIFVRGIRTVTEMFTCGFGKRTNQC